MHLTVNPAPESAQSLSSRSESYIRVVHHPHSSMPTSEIISLDNPPPNHSESHVCLPLVIPGNPWAPFRTCADFEFTELMVTDGSHSKAIKKLLAGFNGRWAPSSYITYKTYADYLDSLDAARNFSVRVSYSLPWQMNYNVIFTFSLSMGK